MAEVVLFFSRVFSIVRHNYSDSRHRGAHFFCHIKWDPISDMTMHNKSVKWDSDTELESDTHSKPPKLKCFLFLSLDLCRRNCLNVKILWQCHITSKMWRQGLAHNIPIPSFTIWIVYGLHGVVSLASSIPPAWNYVTISTWSCRRVIDLHYFWQTKHWMIKLRW